MDGIINRYKKECNKYGYKCEEIFGDIVITTKYEKWKFTPTNGKTCLYHHNALGKTKTHQSNDYHIEFREYISTNDLLKYIYQHEIAKYTHRYVPFAVIINTKQKKYKASKLKEVKCLL